MTLYVVSIFYWKTCIYLYIYKNTYMFWLWYLYRWCHIIALEIALTSWKFTAPKTDMFHQQDASRMSCRSARVPPAKDKWRSYPSNLDISPSKMRWEIRYVLNQTWKPCRKTNSVYSFPPFLDQTSRRETWSWWHNPMGPVPVPSSGWIHPSKFAWTPHGRSISCHTPATFGSSGGVFWCVITFNLFLQTRKSSHPPQVSLPLRQQRPQCQQWQRQRRRTLHWYGLKIWKGLVRLCPQWHWLLLAWYV